MTEKKSLVFGRWNFGDKFWQRVYKRRVEPWLRPKTSKTTRGAEAEKVILAYVTNACNLQCFSCSTLCNTPIGSNEFNRDLHMINPMSLDAFLTNIKGYKPDYWIRLSGGEPTYFGGELVDQLCDIAHIHGRKVDVLTNGYKFTECDLSKLDYVLLDEHNQNRELIKECREHMDEAGYTKYKIIPQSLHRDLNLQRRDNITTGARCGEFMDSISLFRNIIWHCCVGANLTGWENDPRMEQDLNDAGYYASNPNLKWLLENWRETLPSSVYRTCTIHCWRDAPLDQIVWADTG